MTIRELHMQVFCCPNTWEGVAADRLRLYERHCRANYLKVLEALKEEHRITVAFESERITAAPHCPELCDVCCLIAEMEEVKE